LLIVVLVQAHGLLSLDRFTVPPLEDNVGSMRVAYSVLVVLCCVGLVFPWLVDHKVARQPETLNPKPETRNPEP
jgi:hypothetical protein